MASKISRVKKFNITARLIEPIYHNVTVVFEKDGIEIEFIVPVKGPGGDLSAPYQEVEDFLRASAE
ncbi:hypothetical protein [Methylobacterium sp. 10]|uniref:hypothetical protein n=1 Tax=Methylobacterium sp. 10 TaxID=1101191 RepID=UPI0012DD0ADF|nr:hypothetical protein [Methylobacterium sp. 10]